MKFNIPENPDEKKPVDISLKMSSYFGGCFLPTLYANGIPILHILEDGRICLREGKDTNPEALALMGFDIEVPSHRDPARVRVVPSYQLDNNKSMFHNPLTNRSFLNKERET